MRIAEDDGEIDTDFPCKQAQLHLCVCMYVRTYMHVTFTFLNAMLSPSLGSLGCGCGERRSGRPCM